MKKIIQIFFFLFCLIEIKAQSTYIPFPSNMVIFGRTEFTSGFDPTIYTSYRSEISGDTLIGAFNYSKLYSGIGPFAVIAGIRNDTLNKKVYIYSVSAGTEKLLYDFNLLVGDTEGF